MNCDASTYWKNENFINTTYKIDATKLCEYLNKLEKADTSKSTFKEEDMIKIIRNIVREEFKYWYGV